MARIAGVPSRDAGYLTRLRFWFTGRHLARLAGRAPERMLEPLELYARVPRLLRGYAGLEQATAGTHRLDRRLRALAELKAATLAQCEYCIDLGSTIARAWGLREADLLELPTYRTSERFDELDRLVLDYAVGMTSTPVDVPDDLFAALRARLDDVQIVELTHVIALENLRARFNRALGVDAAGFSAGAVCAVPALAPSAAPSGDLSAAPASSTAFGGAVVLVNAFSVPPDEVDRFLEYWSETARVMAAQPGFVRARMCRAVDDDVERRMVNVAEWDSREALGAATAHPEFRASVRRMLDDPDLHVSGQPTAYTVAVDLRPDG